MAWWNPLSWSKRGGQQSVRPDSPLAWSLFALQSSSSGVLVNEQTALFCSAYWSGVRLLSESLAVLPCRMYRRADREVQSVRDHPVVELLENPNPTQTAFNYFQTGMHHILAVGNSYSEILRDGAGRPKELWLMDPKDTDPRWKPDKRSLEYVSKQHEGNRFDASDVVHVPGLGFDGVKGYNLIDYAKQSLGVAIAAEDYAAKWYGSGGMPRGILRHPQKLNDDAMDRIRTDWKKIHSPGSHEIAILREGMDYINLDSDPTKSAALPSRQAQIAEVARYLRVPPHMLFDLDRGSFANVEQMGEEFVTYSLAAWLAAHEQELARKLLTREERKAGLFLKFDIRKLLRGDSVKRATKNQIDINTGIATIAEVRYEEDLPYMQGTDKLRVPLNYGTLDVEGNIVNNGAGNGNIAGGVDGNRCGGPGSGVPGPCAGGGAEDKANTLSGMAKSISAKAMNYARDKIKEKYKSLSGRYGNKMAVAILAAGIIGLPLPIPGSSLIVAAPLIAAAELYRLIGNRDAEPGDLTEEEITKLGVEWMQHILDEWATHDVSKFKE